MADEIRESIEIDTDTAVVNVDDLKSSLEKANEWIDNVIDKARTADKAEVSVPVETPGAVPAAENLDKVDAAARRAGDGARIGVSAISDLTGPLGDASSKAGEMGQAVEGLSGIVEAMAGKMGLSESATAKMTAALGVASVAVAVAAAAWALYKSDQDKAREAAEKMRDVQEKLADKKYEEAAAALVELNTKLYDRAAAAGISVETLTGALLGHKDAADKVNEALAGTERMFKNLPTDAEILNADIDKASVAFQTAGEQLDTFNTRQNAVTTALGGTTQAAEDATTAIDTYISALGRSVPLTPSANKAYNDAVAKYGAGNVSIGPTPTTTHVTNNYPPANTPLAVEQANERWRTTQGYT